jgi:LysM repeat protein
VKKLLRYNDKSDSDLYVGDLVYLKRKKARAARGYEVHEVKEGESLHDIAQEYGIRLRKLCRNNYITPETDLNPGEKIYLRKRATIF